MALDVAGVLAHLKKRPLAYLTALSLTVNGLLWNKLWEAEEYARERCAENRTDNADRINELRENNRALQEFIELQYRVQVISLRRPDSIPARASAGNKER